MGRCVLLALCLALGGACIDFGYDLPSLIRPPSGGGGGDGGACEEGEVPAPGTGLQVRFIGLNVDLRQVQVAAGDTVTWINDDSMVHSVNAGAPGAETPASAGGFNSPDLAPGAAWAYRFCEPRSAFYFCAKHPGQMTGYQVVVQ